MITTIFHLSLILNLYSNSDILFSKEYFESYCWIINDLDDSSRKFTINISNETVNKFAIFTEEMLAFPDSIIEKRDSNFIKALSENLILDESIDKFLFKDNSNMFKDSLLNLYFSEIHNNFLTATLVEQRNKYSSFYLKNIKFNTETVFLFHFSNEVKIDKVYKKQIEHD